MPTQAILSMSFHFTGSSRAQRSVALGGRSSLDGIDPAARARAERLEREQHRKRLNAATRIQSQVRRISHSQQARQQNFEAFDTLLATLSRTLADDNPVDYAQLISATRALLISLGPPHRQLTTSDRRRFLQWVHLVSQQARGLPIVYHLLRQSSDQVAMSDVGVLTLSLSTSWLTLLRLACQHALRMLSACDASSLCEAGLQASNEVMTFLGMLTDARPAAPASSIRLSHGATLAEVLLQCLLQQGLHAAIRSLLISFGVESKAPVATVSLALSLALAPTQVFSDEPAVRTGTSTHDAVLVDDSAEMTRKAATMSPRGVAIRSFANDIVTIPLLRKRLPIASVTELARAFPFDDLIQLIQQHGTRKAKRVADESTAYFLTTPYFLANFLAFASQRVSFFKSGTMLSKYLGALTILQDSLPLAVFQRPGQVHARQTNNVTVVQNGAWTDEETYSRLSILVSESHIQSVISMSNKFPTSTRGPFFAFFCSTLSAWPAEIQDELLNRLLFSTPAVSDTTLPNSARQTSQQKQSSSGPAGTGLIREFWRGYVRGSPLIRTLAAAQPTTKAREILSALSDPESGNDWPALILLCDMLSKVLLTLGDDEFYPERGLLGSNASSRAWLSSEEILSISAVLRNIAFAMYWHEGKVPLTNLADESADGRLDANVPRVPGMRMTLTSLRALVTKLLQQLHARDSRRRFAPPDFWLMVSHLDLNDFIQTVVLEEQQLSSEQHEEATNVAPSAVADSPSVQRDMDLDDDDEDRERPLARLRQLRASGRRFQHLTALNLAFLSPRLGILNNVPFLIPFDVRVQIFRQFVHIDATKNEIYRDQFRRRQSVTIRRSHIAQDGFARLNPLGAELKKPLEIIFVDQWGNKEPGIDGGGLFKEFLTSLVREAFDTNRGLWLASDTQELYPNPHSYAVKQEQLEWYAFLGRVIGKALYEGILVDAKFAGFFLAKMLGKQSYLDDLGSIDGLDKELYRGLISLKNYVGNVEDLSLNFTVTDEEFGVSQTRELIPGGSNIPVTNLNRMEYIYRISHYRLSVQIQAQCNAFFTGLADMINPRWLRNFNREELSVLISGTEDPVDIEDLRKNTVLAGYHEKDLTVQYFWNALESFEQPLRKAFLKFVTSSPNPPLLGFGQLNPQFAIRNAGNDATRLPTASTCVNLLKLPDYADERLCREKLMYAIQSEAGFDLS